MNCITITDPAKCCGCTACRSVCPVSCIKMAPDSKGFPYPVVGLDKCIKCGKCVRVCPFINPYPSRRPTACIAAINSDINERIKSSSGGIFILLAKRIISRGGAVFGAVFTDSFDVRHSGATTLEEVLPMMGSKYVQSDMSEVFEEVARVLRRGREVLFTGTQCQIAGLNHFLDTLPPSLSNLVFTVEVVCHGVPSPLVWRNYLNSLMRKRNRKIDKIDFRDKENGWKIYNFKFITENNAHSSIRIHREFHKDNIYMGAFLANYTLRPSCFKCLAKAGRSNADLSLADFWTPEPISAPLDDDKGTSAVLAWTDKGQKLLDEVDDIILEPADFNLVERGNSPILVSVAAPARLDEFWRVYFEGGLKKAAMTVGIYSPVRRLVRRAKRYVKTLFNKK